MDMMSRVIVVVVGLLLVAAPAWAQLDQILRGLGLGRSGPLADARIAMGLKEALQVATDHAVMLTGKVDGYFGNQAIKILMPDKLTSLETGLRAIGYGPQVDEFVLSMNRAAERAAPAAKQIFLEAIGEMTFDDAREILDGPDTAATDFFKSKTTDRLTAAFRPVIDRSMDEVGVVRQYKQLVGRFEAIPFVKAQAIDLDDYVTDKALDGLFHVLGEQERQIRRDPAARTTELLKEIFGKR
jgi:hypothetical protein